jgi:hypothetical protein
LATIAAGYFLYRNTWDDISAGELTMLAAQGVFAASRYREELLKRGVTHVDTLMAASDLTDWYNKTFVTRPMNRFFSLSEDSGSSSAAFTFDQITKMVQDTHILLANMQTATPKGGRMCVLITTASQKKTHVLCYDQAADRWLFYDSHQSAFADVGSPTGSRLYVFNPHVRTQVADYVSPVLDVKEKELDLTFYTKGSKTVFSVKTEDEEYRQLEDALRLFGEGSYAQAEKAFKACSSSREPAIALLCNGYLSEINSIYNTINDSRKLALVKKLLDPREAAENLPDLLRRVRYADDAFVRAIARKFYTYLEAHELIYLAAHDGKSMWSEMVPFFTDELPSLLGELSEDLRGGRATVRNAFSLAHTTYAGVGELVRWLLQTLASEELTMSAGSKSSVAALAETKRSVLEMAANLLKEGFAKEDVVQYLVENGLTEKDLPRVS